MSAGPCRSKVLTGFDREEEEEDEEDCHPSFRPPSFHSIGNEPNKKREREREILVKNGEGKQRRRRRIEKKRWSAYRDWNPFDCNRNGLKMSCDAHIAIER